MLNSTIEIQSPKKLWFAKIGAPTAKQAQEYIPTFVTEFSILAAQIIAYKLAAYYLGQQGFSIYAVARRTISLLVAFPLLGLGVALPRYLARCTRSSSEVASAYYGAALRSIAVASIFCFVLINFTAHSFAYLFLGNSQYSQLAFPISIMLLGLAMHSIVYAYFRGHLAMKQANVIQFINYGAVPLLCLFAFHHSTRLALLMIGACWMGVAGVALCFTPFQFVSMSNKREARELLHYGLQRVPGDFLMAGLLTLPVTFVAHRIDLRSAGFLAFGISMLSMIGALFTPVGLILLPKASTLLALGDRKELRRHVELLVKTTLAVTVLLSFLLEIFSPIIIKFYLGTSFVEIVPFIRWIALGAIPYGFYFALRGLVDAFHVKAVNTINISIAFTVFLLCSFVFSSHNGAFSLTFPLVAGLYALGLLTVLESGKILA